MSVLDESRWKYCFSSPLSLLNRWFDNTAVGSVAMKVTAMSPVAINSRRTLSFSPAGFNVSILCCLCQTERRGCAVNYTTNDNVIFTVVVLSDFCLEKQKQLLLTLIIVYMSTGAPKHIVQFAHIYFQSRETLVLWRAPPPASSSCFVFHDTKKPPHSFSKLICFFSVKMQTA